MKESGAREFDEGRWDREMSKNDRFGRVSEPRGEVAPENSGTNGNSSGEGFLSRLSSAAGKILNLGSKGDGTKVDPKAAARRGSKTK